ncbi:arrestin domain-containing protein 2 [Frankliniella occidentalis]|uniref:Arrestin domain-containing protein 2 n=1 Tax=Frankliniella occidentalis TaxID=133901 RepID=A0A6J1SPJ3_FRAOC|nr:arrestin domain-containing protein 2 [Frankliniella occidentalis]
MPANIRILFDNHYATFYAGQTVTGRVIVTVDKPKKLRAITINFKGEAEVKWTETERKKDSQGKDYDDQVIYKATETYYENKYHLLGSESGEIELNPGEYSYPFTCQIPISVPSSFEGEHGYIRYTVKATLDRPWKFDQESKAAFTVVAPLDLNTLPQAKEPIEFEKVKNFCCLWCKSGPLTLTVKVPAGGFVPGQTIPFQVEIENGSNIRVRPINCVLRKEVTWHARDPIHKTQKTKTTLGELAVDDEVKPHESKSFSKDIIVPAIPPSNLANCGIIDLEYILKIEAVVSGFHKNVSARIPVVMGTIPLLTGPTAYKPGGTAVVQPGQPSPNPASPAKPAQLPSPTLGLVPIPTPSLSPAPAPAPAPAPGSQVGGGWNLPPAAAPSTPPSTNPSTAPSAPPLYPQLPPPSYEESIWKGNSIKDSTDNEHTMGIQDFTPRYPVWTFDPVAPPAAQAP